MHQHDRAQLHLWLQEITDRSLKHKNNFYLELILLLLDILYKRGICYDRKKHNDSW